MNRIAGVTLLALMLSSCGGNGDSSARSYHFQGVVSGANCFGGFPESASVSYSIRLDEQSTGSGVTLVDQAGNTWIGTMTSSTAFKVTNASPTADPRTSIVVSDLTAAGARVDSTTACVSFRCCTTLSGDVRP